MELDDMTGPHVLHRHVSERGDDVQVDGGPVEAFRLGLAVDLHVGAHAARREVGDGGVGLGLRRDRVEAALDAVYDLGGLAAPLVDRLPCDGSEGDAFQAGGSAGLDDEDLAPVALDAHTEAREVAVPVDGVPAGGRQGGDAAGGEAEGASLRHGVPRRCGAIRASTGAVRIVSSNRIRAASTRGGSLEPVWSRFKGEGTLRR